MIFHNNQKEQAKEFIDNLEQDFEIKKIFAKRSLSQNAYFHGVILVILCDSLGYNALEMKQELKEMFLSYYNEERKRNFVKDTHDLNTVEFEDFNAKCRKFGAENSIFIPLPNEVTYEMQNMLDNLKNRISKY